MREQNFCSRIFLIENFFVKNKNQMKCVFYMLICMLILNFSHSQKSFFSQEKSMNYLSDNQDSEKDPYSSITIGTDLVTDLTGTLNL